MSTPFTFTVTAADAGRRLDRLLQRELGKVPGSLVQRLLRQRKVRLNGRRARADQRVAAGDCIEVHHRPRQTDRRTPEPAPRPYGGPPIDILDQRGDLLFVDKPAGVSCSDDGSDPRALDRWIQTRFAERIRTGELRPEPCHRLDRQTTGVLAIALNVAAFDRFRVALQQERVRKLYEVAVWAQPDWEERLVELDLQRLPRARRDGPRMQVVADSISQERTLEARTHLEVLRRGRVATLLRAELITGRTHQIRVHCRALGLPVIGDPRYGDADRDGRIPAVLALGRQLLHARSLVLRDAEGEISIEADWPADAASVLLELGLSD